MSVCSSVLAPPVGISAKHTQLAVSARHAAVVKERKRIGFSASHFLCRRRYPIAQRAQKLFKSPKIGDVRRKSAVFVLFDGDILSLKLRILRAQNGFVGEKASRTHDRRGGDLKR